MLTEPLHLLHKLVSMYGAELLQNVGLGDVHPREVAGYVDDARSLVTFDLAIGQSPCVVPILGMSQAGELGLHQAGFPENTGLFDAADVHIDIHYCRASELHWSGRGLVNGLVDKADCRSGPDKSEQSGHGIIESQRSCHLVMLASLTLADPGGGDV